MMSRSLFKLVGYAARETWSDTPRMFCFSLRHKGLDYVAAHLIKCLGTDSDRSFASDPERVFTVLLGLFRGYGLQYLYSEDLAALQLMLRVLDELIETHLPRLHKHFQEQVEIFAGSCMAAHVFRYMGLN